MMPCQFESSLWNNIASAWRERGQKFPFSNIINSKTIIALDFCYSVIFIFVFSERDFCCLVNLSTFSPQSLKNNEGFGVEMRLIN